MNRFRTVQGPCRGRVSPIELGVFPNFFSGNFKGQFNYFKPVNRQSLEICYVARLQYQFKTVRRYVCPIPFNVSLHLKYFEVVQGQVLLAHQRTCDPLAIAGFIYLFIYLRTQHSKQYKIEDTIKAAKF